MSRNVGDNGIVPIASRYDPGMGVIIEVYDGDVAFDEWHDHIAAMLDDPVLGETTRSLVDMSSARLEPLTDEQNEEMHSLFEARSMSLTGRKMAIIAGQSGTERDVEQRAVERLKGRAIVFSSVATACIWLGVEEKAVTTAVDNLRASLHQQ